MDLCGGIDEAGRGPVIGPLVIGCVVLDNEGRERLAELNVRDSKRVSPKRRTKLEPEIKKHAIEWSMRIINPAEIDRLRKKHSLNAIEAAKTAEIITSMNTIPATIYLDAVDNGASHYRDRVLNYINSLNDEFIIPNIISEHKADDRYIEVAAASILAKVERDRIIESIKIEHGDFGSGYPSDEKTSEFIRNLLKTGRIPDFVRKSWNTLEKSKQTRLGDY